MKFLLTKVVLIDWVTPDKNGFALNKKLNGFTWVFFTHSPLTDAISIMGFCSVENTECIKDLGKTLVAHSVQRIAPVSARTRRIAEGPCKGQRSVPGSSMPAQASF